MLICTKKRVKKTLGFETSTFVQPALCKLPCWLQPSGKCSLTWKRSWVRFPQLPVRAAVVRARFVQAYGACSTQQAARANGSLV